MRLPEERTERAIRFLSEQDGPHERKLKSAVSPLLAKDLTVVRAYLAQVAYGSSSEHEVALCIQAPESPDLVRLLSSEFARLFSSAVHLDALFLTPHQEAELRRVCQPFYEAG